MTDTVDNIDNIIAMIKDGHKECYEDLWYKVKRFVRKEAMIFANKTNHQDYLDDMMQEGFLCLFDAVEYYSIDNEKTFIGLLADFYLPRAFEKACFSSASENNLNKPLNNYISIYSPISSATDDMMLIDTIIDTHSEDYYEAIENTDFWKSAKKYLYKGVDYLRDPEERELLQYMLDNNESYGKAYKIKLLGDRSRERYRQIFNSARKNLLRWIRTKGKTDAMKTGIDIYFNSNRLYSGGLASFRNHSFTSQTEAMAIELCEMENRLKAIESLRNMVQPESYLN